ncbi:unnamed protein product [Symbiodinium natans]|uniref:Uncharacterized protein n=1 Tax=Symbiodinium natans TaxID=878477 RepID=A0A812GKC3_9DINO|nr:unnamed protein product [Symbiodinium natans]
MLAIACMKRGAECEQQIQPCRRLMQRGGGMADDLRNSGSGGGSAQAKHVSSPGEPLWRQRAPPGCLPQGCGVAPLCGDRCVCTHFASGACGACGAGCAGCARAGPVGAIAELLTGSCRGRRDEQARANFCGRLPFGSLERLPPRLVAPQPSQGAHRSRLNIAERIDKASKSPDKPREARATRRPLWKSGCPKSAHGQANRG